MIKYGTGVSEAPAHQCKSHAIRCFLMQLFCRSWERSVITGAEVVATPFFYEGSVHMSMHPINYFKFQSKRLLKDLKTYVPDDEVGYRYSPKYFDVDAMLLSVDYRVGPNPTLMKAQHLMALINDFESWDELIHANPDRLEMAKKMFETQDKTPLDSWYEWLHFVVNHSEGGGLIGNYELQRALVELCIETNDFPVADFGVNYFLTSEE